MTQEKHYNQFYLTYDFISRRIAEGKDYLKECLERNDEDGILTYCEKLSKLYSEKRILDHIIFLGDYENYKKEQENK